MNNQKVISFRTSNTIVLVAAGDYAANDVMNSAGAAAITFIAANSPLLLASQNRGILINNALLSIQDADVTPRTRLFLYNSAPTGQLTDNAANDNPIAANVGAFRGVIDFPALGVNGGAVSFGQSVPGFTLPLQMSGLDTGLFGVLVTLDACTTESAGMICTLALECSVFPDVFTAF